MVNLREVQSPPGHVLVVVLVLPLMLLVQLLSFAVKQVKKGSKDPVMFQSQALPNLRVLQL